MLLADEQEQLKVTCTGLKLFERHNLKDKQPGGKPGATAGGAPAAAESAAAAAAGAAAGEAAAANGQPAGMEAEGEVAGGVQGDGLKRVCQYRLVQEGLPFILPHITKQVGGGFRGWWTGNAHM